MKLGVMVENAFDSITLFDLTCETTDNTYTGICKYGQ